MKSNTLKVNEIIFTLQGEGQLAGMPVVFVRLSGCNKACYFCDTKHETGEELSIPIIISRVKTLNPDCTMVIFTGGEPLLQLDSEVVEAFIRAGYNVGLETNGSLPIPDGVQFNYISVSPKVTPMEVKKNFPQGTNEIRYPLKHGQTPPPLHILPDAERYYVSPVFRGNTLIKQNVDWCIQFCKDNPQWSLSIQLHKILGFA
jgi:7-carboxy-7-deazaguanine synthase